MQPYIKPLHFDLLVLNQTSHQILSWPAEVDLSIKTRVWQLRKFVQFEILSAEDKTLSLHNCLDSLSLLLQHLLHLLDPLVLLPYDCFQPLFPMLQIFVQKMIKLFFVNASETCKVVCNLVS